MYRVFTKTFPLIGEFQNLANAAAAARAFSNGDEVVAIVCNTASNIGDGVCWAVIREEVRLLSVLKESDKEVPMWDR